MLVPLPTTRQDSCSKPTPHLRLEVGDLLLQQLDPPTHDGVRERVDPRTRARVARVPPMPVRRVPRVRCMPRAGRRGVRGAGVAGTGPKTPSHALLC